MPVAGWVAGSIMAALLGTVFALLIATMNKKVARDSMGRIDFRKSDIYFFWTRWDFVIIICAVYSFACITGLFVLLISGGKIDNPWVQFFIHQTFVFTLLSFIWFITRIAFILKGIKERWPDEFR
jgi:hypothetical protein